MVGDFLGRFIPFKRPEHRASLDRTIGSEANPLHPTLYGGDTIQYLIPMLDKSAKQRGLIKGSIPTVDFVFNTLQFHVNEATGQVAYIGRLTNGKLVKAKPTDMLVLADPDGRGERVVLSGSASQAQDLTECYQAYKSLGEDEAAYGAFVTKRLEARDLAERERLRRLGRRPLGED